MLQKIPKDLGGVFQNYRCVCRREESGFVLGRGKVDAMAEGFMEVAGEGGVIAFLCLSEIPDRSPREVEAAHGADPLEGEGLPLDDISDGFLHLGTE